MDIMRALGCTLLGLSVACGSMDDANDNTNNPGNTNNNTNNTNNPAGNTTNTTDNTPKLVRINELRDGAIPVYTVVTLENVVVTASFGNKKAFYVQDPQATARGGILVERCKECTWTAPLLGTTVSLTGKYFTRNGDMWISVGPDSFKPSTQTSPLPTALQVTGADLKKDGTAGLNAYGMRVTLTDGPYVVTSVTPQEQLNTGYDASGTGCSNGPQYMGVEVQNAQGHTVLLDTACYRNIDITTSKACSKTSRLIELGRSFTSLGGVFDFKQGKRLLIPTDKADYQYDG